MRASSYFIILLVGLVLPTPALNAQSSEIDAALKSGNAGSLGTFMHKMVEVSIPGIEDSFSSDQAITVLTSFFTENKVREYKQIHLIRAQEGRAKYSIGDLVTAKGNFRITIYYNTLDKITGIRIQK